MNPLLRWLARLLQRLLAQFVARRPNQASPDGPASALPIRSPPAIETAARSCASVIIPALNEATRIAEVVAYALSDSATAEVLVIDDSSIDQTANLARAAGAKVITSTMLGKGASMQDGARLAQCSLLVYLDGDLSGLRSGIVSDLCRPLLQDTADFVKARFGRSGGRVTELTAKPMLKIFFPELAHIVQPLGGIVATRRSLLQGLQFEDGYGVDVGLLVDAHLCGARITEVDIGSIEHDSQPLHDLALMANEIGRVIFGRARSAGRLHIDQISAMYESQRQAAAGIDYVLTRRRNRQRLLLLDMDGTITETNYIRELARFTGHQQELDDLMVDTLDANTRVSRVAAMFRFVHKQQFTQVARELGIRPGVIDFVNQVRRRGFMVGVVTHSYFIAAELIRRRIFADFAMAHTLQFEQDVCTGQVRINSGFLADGVGAGAMCKSHLLRRFLDDPTAPRIQLSWVIGSQAEDLPLMRLANRAFAFGSGDPPLRGQDGITVIDSFNDLLALLPDHELVTAPVRTANDASP